MSSALLTDIGHTPLLLLPMILGVAFIFISLGGENLVCLIVSPNFITTFPMLPGPIPYTESESLLLWQSFFCLAFCFLISFSSLSILLLNCMKDCFVGLGFFPPFLVVQSWIFLFHLSCTHNYNNPWYCAWYNCPHVSCTDHNASWCKLSCFLGTLPVYLVPGLLFPFLPLWEDFSLDCTLDLSWVHPRSVVSRDIRSKRLSRGVIISLWCWTDPAMYVGTSNKCDLLDQPWQKARSWELCWTWHLGCSTSKSVAWSRS